MLGAACAISLTFFNVVDVEGSLVRLGQIADLSVLPAGLADRASQVPVLRLDRTRAQVEVSRHELASQIGARLPVLDGCFATEGSAVVLQRQESGWRPQVAVGAGQGVAKGDQVVVRIAAPLITIQREGLALARAKPGQYLFVRTGDGGVIRALVTGEKQ